MVFNDLLNKKWGNEISEQDVLACHEEAKDIFAFSIKTLISPDFVPGRVRVWLNDDNRIEAIVLELKNGKHIRAEKPYIKMYEWPDKIPHGPKSRDPF